MMVDNQQEYMTHLSLLNHHFEIQAYQYKIKIDKTLSVLLTTAKNIFQTLDVADDESVNRFYINWKKFKQDLVQAEIDFNKRLENEIKEKKEENRCYKIFKSLFSCCSKDLKPNESYEDYQEARYLDNQIELFIQKKKMPPALRKLYDSFEDNQLKKIFFQLVSEMNTSQQDSAKYYLPKIIDIVSPELKIQYITYLLQHPVHLRESLYRAIYYLEQRLKDPATLFEFLRRINHKSYAVQINSIYLFKTLVCKVKSKHLYPSIVRRLMKYSDKEIIAWDENSLCLIEQIPKLSGKFEILEHLLNIPVSQRAHIAYFLSTFKELKIDEFYLKRYITFLMTQPTERLPQLQKYLKVLASKLVDVPFLHELSRYYFIFPPEFSKKFLSLIISIPFHKKTTLHTYIMQQFLGIPLNQLENRIDLLRKFIDTDLDEREINILVKAFFRFYDQFEPILKTNVLTLLSSFSLASNRIRLLFKINKLPISCRERILYITEQVSHFAVSDAEISALFHRILEINERERVQICEQLLVYLIFFQKKNRLDELILQLEAIPFNERINWLQTKAPLKVANDRESLDKIWIYLETYPGQLLDHVIKQYYRLKVNCFDCHTQPLLISTLIQIPINELEERVNYTLRLSKMVYGNDRILKIFKSIATFPLPLDPYIELLESILLAVEYQDDKVLLIVKILSASLNDLQIYHDIKLILNIFSSKRELHEFCNLILSLDPIKRSQVCKNAVSLSKIIQNSDFEMQVLKMQIACERDLTKAAQLFMKIISSFKEILKCDDALVNPILIFDSLINFSDEELQKLEGETLDFIHILIPFYQLAKSDAKRATILAMALHMPMLKKEIFSEYANRFLKHSSFKNDIDQLLIFFQLIPSDNKIVIQSVIESLFQQQNKPLMLNDLLNLLNNKFSALHQKLSHHILELVHSSHHLGYIHILTSELIENPEMIGISFESQHYQLLLSYYLQSMPNDSSLRNPYRIYAKQISNSQLPLLEFPFHDGYQISSSMLKNLYTASKSVSVADLKAYLQEGIQSSINFRAFHELLIRVLNKQKLVESSGIVSAVKLNNLIKNFITDPLIIFFWSILEKVDDYEITVDQNRFFVLMKFLFSKEDSLALTDKLTLQEELCIQMLLSIQFCRAGKLGGIKEYYDMVIKEFLPLTDIQGIYEELPDLKAFIMGYFESIFHNPKVLNQIVDVQEDLPIPEMVHHALFVKNILGIRLGLNHNLQFDLHANLLTDKWITLINSKESIINAVKIIDGHFNTFLLAEKLDERIQTLLKRISELETIKETLEQDQEKIEMNHEEAQFKSLMIQNLNNKIRQTHSRSEIHEFMCLKNQLSQERKDILNSLQTFQDNARLLEQNLRAQEDLFAKLKNLGWSSERQDGLSILKNLGIVIQE